MDGEDDYMGDLSQFLQPQHLHTFHSVPATDGTGNEGTSGLRRQERRKQRRLEQQQLEDKHLSDGLSSAISPSNIGFRMLQQMGYTPGSALGKHGHGSPQPISLDIKRSRSGIGRDSIVKAQQAVKEKLLAIQHETRLRKQEELKSSFQDRRRSSWKARKIARDYRKACIALSQLQAASGCSEEGLGRIEEQDEHDSKEDTEEDDEDEITLEAFQEVLEMLRSNYFYCLYCGCQYESADALLCNCPGPEEDDH